MTDFCPAHAAKAVSLGGGGFKKVKGGLKGGRGTTWYKPQTKKSGKVRPSGDSELEMPGEDYVASQKAVSR